jgi:hypothetical protein
MSFSGPFVFEDLVLLLPGLALNSQSSCLLLLSSWDYSCEPLVSAPLWLFEREAGRPLPIFENTHFQLMLTKYSRCYWILIDSIKILSICDTLKFSSRPLYDKGVNCFMHLFTEKFSESLHAQHYGKCLKRQSSQNDNQKIIRVWSNGVYSVCHLLWHKDLGKQK